MLLVRGVMLQKICTPVPKIESIHEGISREVGMHYRFIDCAGQGQCISQATRSSNNENLMALRSSQFQCPLQ